MDTEFVDGFAWGKEQKDWPKDQSPSPRLIEWLGNQRRLCSEPFRKMGWDLSGVFVSVGLCCLFTN